MAIKASTLGATSAAPMPWRPRAAINISALTPRPPRSEAAANTPFGGTVAHGFLTLSLLSRMAADVMLRPEAVKMGVNYGFEKVRFIAPVRSGKRVRGHFRLELFEEKRPGEYRFIHQVTVEIEGEDKPALVADWIGLIFV